MNVKEIAKLLGCSELTVRIGLQQGAFPFGTAIKLNPDSKRYNYIIYEEKVREFLTGRERT